MATENTYRVSYIFYLVLKKLRNVETCSQYLVYFQISKTRLVHIFNTLVFSFQFRCADGELEQTNTANGTANDKRLADVQRSSLARCLI